MRSLKKLFKNQCGTAAVEFGLVLPVLASIVILMPDVTQAASGAINMDSAVRAGIQYAMNGGTDTSTVQTYVNQNWVAKPTGATATATLACFCDSSTLTCGQPCTGTLSSTVTIAATATVGGLVINVPLSKTQSVRVQ